ncbi:cytochrome c oxidase subunit 3 family protein [candidate division KSB1 bacterium]
MEEVKSHIEEHRDDVGAKIGMWLFLFTEILLFGGLFIVYSIYRYRNQGSFHLAAQELNVALGAINTVILLISSCTVAMSITAIQKGHKKLSGWLILITIIFGLGFLVNKYFEWGAKFHHGLYPGSELMTMLSQGDMLFYTLYFAMTGLHGLHIVVGITVLLVIYFRVLNGRIHAEKFVFLENGGLYWHLVDLIWIFLFPLFYLIT